MKKLKKRLQAIMLLVRVGWERPEMFTVTAFQSMSQLMEILLKVANDGQPMMTKLATVVANEQHDLVTIWAGKGANASPYDRIVELRNEVDELKHQLSEAIKEANDKSE